MYACKGGHLDVVKYLHEAGSEELLMATTDVSACLYSVRGACIYLEEIVRTCSYVKYRYMIHAYLHPGMHACIHFCLCLMPQACIYSHITCT
jgi:hypothetical protein